MASLVYTGGLREMLAGGVAYLTDTIKVMLVKSGYVPNKDDDFVDAGGANDPVDHELTVSGYTPGFGGAGRKTLASKTITANDTNDRVEIDAADVTWTALASGETIAGAIAIKEGGANDTTSRLLIYGDPTDTPTNGSDITLQFAAAGLANITT